MRALPRLCGTALLVCASAGWGCAGGTSTDAARGEPAGRVGIERVDSRALRAEAPSRATYCAAESALTILALGGGLTGGIAVRAAPPLSAPQEFTAQRARGGLGTAVVAFRPLVDSVGGALVAVAGTVQLASADPASGRFAVTAELPGGGRVALRGTFRNVPVVATGPTSCGSAWPTR